MTNQTTAVFDPRDFGFVELDRQYQSIKFFERNSGSYVDGQVNVNRLNVYMTQDGPFTCIWSGLFDLVLINPALADAVGPEFDFAAAYNEPLFRGYIETPQDAVVILRTLRLAQYGSSLLRLDADQNLICEPMLL